jgi:hypothetical protein
MVHLFLGKLLAKVLFFLGGDLHPGKKGLRVAEKLSWRKQPHYELRKSRILFIYSLGSHEPITRLSIHAALQSEKRASRKPEGSREA